MRRAALTVALALVAVAPSAASALPFQQHGPLPRYVPGQVIVEFEPGTPAAARSDALRDHGARLARRLPIARTVLARTATGADVQAAAHRIERDPRVENAEPNAIQAGNALPNDALFAEEWGLDNTGQTVAGESGTPGADIHAAQAWNLTTGSQNVKVAVVDSGINFNEPDLAPNIWRNPGESGGGRESNGVDDDGNGYVDDWRGWDFVQGDNDPSDTDGHGTHVAGTLAARGNNGIGVAGVAWKATIIPVRVLDNVNMGACAQIAAGLEYAVRSGARIVNLSVGGPSPCQLAQQVADSAPNTLFVVSAANDGADVDATPYYPCAYPSPNIVCVAATDSSDRLASFSNYGAHGVDLAAPGVNVLSSWLKWGPTETLFPDDFEQPLAGRWTTGGSPDSWTRTPFAPLHGGGFALSSSLTGGAADDSDNWVRRDGTLDLTGRHDCAARVWLSSSLPPVDPARPLEEQDLLVGEPAADGTSFGVRPQALLGGADYQRAYMDLSSLEGRSTGTIRFHLRTNGDRSGGGVTLDDFDVICVPPETSYSGAIDEFALNHGTSMAAPHVSGAAVLLLSLYPNLTTAQLKQRLLGSVDHLPSLAGKTVTGGRLNVARALQPQVTPAQGLKIDLAALARSVKQGGLRTVDSRGGFRADRLHGFGPGRFTLAVKGAYGRTLATGSCGVARPAVCSLMAWLTPLGRSVVRGASRVPVTLVLTFAPRGGRVLAERTMLTLLR